MLRDISTRFFGKKYGFLLAIAWPLSHILILIAINIALGRMPPYGDSTALWFATGVIPFMCFSYMTRFIMLGVVLNKSLLSFPMVKITDILIARALVEVINATVVVFVTVVLFAILGINFVPTNVVQAAFALGACMFLGLGFGIINAIIAAAVPMWITGYALFIIILWMASGVMFVPDGLPALFRYVLAFNPALQGVEWMRSAYYEGYGTGVLDKTYMLEVSAFTLAIGLVIERAARGRLLQ